MTINRLADSEIFIIHCPERVNDGQSILYAPLKSDIYTIDEETEQILLSGEVLEGETLQLISELNSALPSFLPRDLTTSTRLSLIPNNICNFSCSYCYSAAGRSNAKIDENKLHTVLDWFVDSYRIGNNAISIFITGGGEPFVTPDLTMRAISESRTLAKDRNVKLYISLITNGSLLTDEIIQFLLESECSVCVSYEVLRDLQQSQRKDYDKVTNNISSLLEAGIRTMLSSTITPMSVGRMEEMTEIVCRDFPNISQFSMEPVTSADLFACAEDLRSFYSSFRKNYYASKKIANEHKIHLRFTFDDALDSPTVRHCPGKLTLTPQGTFSACHLVSSIKESRYKDCIYGEVTADGVVSLNQERFNELFNLNMSVYPECKDCIAKWSCGGECMTRRTTYPKEYMAEVCRFNRQIIVDQIISAVNGH